MNLDRLLDLAYRLARFGAWFGGGLIVAAAVLVGIEVVIRKAFNLTIGGADELSGHALAIATSWGLAFTLLERAHVRIDSLYIHLPVRLAALLDLIGLALLIGFFGLVTWHGYGVFATSMRVGAHSLSPLGTPLVIPQALWVAGLALFLVIATLLLVRALGAFVQGDLVTMRRLVGSRTLTEEMAAELERPEDAASAAEVRARR